MEGIQLPAALALLLGTDLIGARKRPLEYPLQGRLACDLAADVADDAAEPRAQNVQLSAVQIELLGVGICRFLPLMSLPASNPGGSIQGPPFSALFTLWLSMMAAVGLASRPARARDFY